MNSTNYKPKTRQQIANEFGISISTFQRWLKRNNISIPPGLVLPAKQNEIYKKFYLEDSSEN